jgi:flavodoxin
MRRILVVYYSRTGYTRTLARTIAAAVKADVETLAGGRERHGLWGYRRCARGGGPGDALSTAAATRCTTA